MRKLMIGFILIGISMSACNGQKVACETEELNVQLLEVHKKDQEIRREFMPVLAKYQEDGSGKLHLLRLGLKMQRQDARNQEFIVQMLEKCGWSDSLNQLSHETIFLVLQHSPDSLMRKYFPIVKQMVKNGKLAPDDKAIMFDRLQMHAGLPQKYGSQTFASGGLNYIWPVQNLDSLAYFREQVNLPSMEEYMKIASDSFGVKYTWDKEMTLIEAKELHEESNFD